MDEHPKLIKRDWRLHAITTTTAPWKSPATGFEHQTGTILELAGYLNHRGEVFGIPVPDASAMFLSLAIAAGQKGRAVTEILTETRDPSTIKNNRVDFRRIEEDAEQSFIDCVQDLFAAVVFSHTAVGLCQLDHSPRTCL